MSVFADGQKVHPSRIVTDQVSESFKKMIINTARSWPVYFSRLFPVSVRYFRLVSAALQFAKKSVRRLYTDIAEFRLQENE